ncbi:hypothetical protein C0W80_03045 [Photobacterium leiognathi subsp. mandapamensis]|uniref:hypothetical protein n=1 Tax=Photobacterium leiognathi TaxID=553611 RepID=UPI000D16A0ED|nr:hypothetical protein [Photobacterium leiognathi]PSV03164.1 hypothetical protein C0W80_03045 [Photobacterium leiognathi subsp. mandapamensis]
MSQQEDMCLSENLRIGFYGVIDENKAMPEVVRREFKLEIYKEMREKTNILWESQPFYFAWSLVFKNYDEYLSIKTKRQKLNVHPKILMGGDKPYLQMSDISRATINFLATASTFLIVSQRLIKNYFGENSEIYTKWNLYRQDLHAKSNEYQVCYELRNFSQHYQIPLSGINMDFRNGHSEGGDPYIIVDELLTCGYNWKKVGVILESLESQVCLSELLAGYYDCLKELFLSGHMCFEGSIEMSRSYINEIIRNFDLPKECTPIVFTLDPLENDFNKLDQEYMPVGLHRFIDDITKQSTRC